MVSRTDGGGRAMLTHDGGLSSLLSEEAEVYDD